MATAMTDTMRERKKAMEDNSDGFIVMPGGIGTFEEFFEILVAKQLGQHSKPIAIFNVAGYYDKLLEFMNEITDKKFMNPASKELYFISSDVNECIDYLETHLNEKIEDISRYKYIENGVADEKK